MSNQEIRIITKTITHKAAGNMLAKFEAVHGKYSLRQAEPLRHVSYFDASRLDGCDLIEGILWLLQKGTERDATLRDDSQAAMPCNQEIKRFWHGFSGLVGDYGVPMVLRIGMHTRLWVPQA